MNKILKIIIGIIVIVLVLLAIFSGEKTQDGVVTSVVEDGPIVLGYIGPLTGDAAAYGEPLQLTTQLAVDEINQAGGVNGRQIEVVYEDGACNGTDAINAMNKLVNVDKVDVILGGFCSGESLAAVPLATSKKTLLISPGSSSPDLTDISDYFVRTYPSDAKQGEVLADVLFDQEGVTHVAFIQEQTDYALGVYNAFSAAFESKGGKVSREVFATEETDFRTSLTKLRQGEPGALFVSVQTPASGERVLQQIDDLDWDIQLLISDALAGDPATIAKNAERLEGAFAALFDVDSSLEAYTDFIETYSQEYGSCLLYTSPSPRDS